MDILSMVALALGLSLDALAVSVTNAVTVKNLEVKYGLRMAFFFGFFQMLMPIIGWAAGTTFTRYISSWDHWIAFGLLCFLGIRMVIGGLKSDKEEGQCSDNPQDCRRLSVLFLLSIATSIDALAVGLTFAFINVSIILPAAIIGIITFGVCVAGYFIGSKLGKIVNLRLEIIGGIILIAIGSKILFDHLIH